jgi:hypothetical protein
MARAEIWGLSEWNSRNHTNKVRLRGLRKNQGLKPTQVGFACVDTVSNRPFYVKLTPMKLLLYPYV